MGICDSKKKITNNKLGGESLSSNEVILCKHCKRTSANGIRCLGMCVADNDY